MQETQVWFLGQEDPLKKKMATHEWFQSVIIFANNTFDFGIRVIWSWKEQGEKCFLLL